MNILQKNMQPVYDSARRQGYEVWNTAQQTGDLCNDGPVGELTKRCVTDYLADIINI